MHLPVIFLPALLCTASSATPVGNPNTDISIRSRPFQTFGNPSLASSIDAHSLRARQPDAPIDTGAQTTQPTAKVRPRFPPSVDDLPSLANMMAQANNLSLPLRAIIALEHYRYRERLPLGYATAYDAQRERNRTIADELSRCQTLWNDCDDLMSHHHRIDRGQTCIGYRKAGEALYDQEMDLVEQGRRVLQGLKARALEKREETANSAKEGGRFEWYCYILPLSSCDGFPRICHVWPFQHKCQYCEKKHENSGEVPRNELARIDAMKDPKEKAAAEAELANRIKGNGFNTNDHERRRRLAYYRLPLFMDDENGVEHLKSEDAPHQEVSERSSPLDGFQGDDDARPALRGATTKRKRSRKALPWDIVGAGVVYIPMTDEWGTDTNAACTDTWVEPGVLGETDTRWITAQEAT